MRAGLVETVALGCTAQAEGLFAATLETNAAKERIPASHVQRFGFWFFSITLQDSAHHGRGRRHPSVLRGKEALLKTGDAFLRAA